MTAPIFFLLNILRFFLSIFPKFLHFPVAFHQLSVFHSSTSFFYITYFFFTFPYFSIFFFLLLSVFQVFLQSFHSSLAILSVYLITLFFLLFMYSYPLYFLLPHYEHTSLPLQQVRASTTIVSQLPTLHPVTINRLEVREWRYYHWVSIVFDRIEGTNLNKWVYQMEQSCSYYFSMEKKKLRRKKKWRQINGK